MDDFQKDLFGLSEIEKIQDEIERDLRGERLAVPQLAIVPEETAEIIPADFYRETIKPAAPKKSWARAAVALIFICTLGMGALGFGIGAGWAFFRENAPTDNAVVRQPAAQEGVPLSGAAYVFEPVISEHPVASISDMVELLAPSVVGITTYRDHAEVPFLPARSYGSGIIFSYSDDKIFIATNLYAVRRGYRWDVSIAGSEPLTARPVWYSRDYDLAVAYVLSEDLAAAGIESIAFASFGDSDEMRIGDVVLAIGNAMGEGTSVTRGIISAEERPIHLPDRAAAIPVLQTDAAINYGNSGGPLINTRGEIVGININVVGSSPVEGMGYSISSNIAAPILAAIINTPAIGITGFSLADDEQNRAELWEIPAMGVLVYSVAEGLPAYNAGIRAEDVITTFDGQPIFEMRQLRAAIRARDVGDIVELNILRGGTQAITVELELALMASETFGMPGSRGFYVIE